jgi:hypothetical protein
MTSLDLARQGKSAARQLRAMMNAKVIITDRELDRLLSKIEEGFEQMMPTRPTTPTPDRGSRGLTVHDGGRP